MIRVARIEIEHGGERYIWDGKHVPEWSAISAAHKLRAISVIEHIPLEVLAAVRRLVGDSEDIDGGLFRLKAVKL